MPNEMVEKVARAICASNVTYNGPKDTKTLQERIDEEWTNWVDDARAAIEVLLNPTKSMLDKGQSTADDCMDADYNSGSDCGCAYNYLRSDAPHVIYQAMLRAALD